MRSQLAELIEKGELALGSCQGVVDYELLEEVGRALANVRTRLAYPDDVLVVALAGGTGSGKSSIFNAIAGDDLVDVGGIRPTTSRPAALVPAGGALDSYLDLMGVEDRHEGAGPGWLCLIDLPDYDSVETAHRLVVDDLLSVVDVVVWVADPEKYRDARFHHEYLAPLAGFREQFLFVLNQVDRMSADQLGQVMADFGDALEEAGMPGASVLPMSVAPQQPAARGVDELLDAIADRRDGQVYAKLLTDLRGVTAQLTDALGTPVEFDSRAAAAVDAALAELEAGRVGAASDVLTRFIDEVATETGGAIRVRLNRVAADIPRHMSRIARREDGEAGGQIREAIVRPARAILAKRALAIASAAEFALAVGDLARS